MQIHQPSLYRSGAIDREPGTYAGSVLFLTGRCWTGVGSTVASNTHPARSAAVQVVSAWPRNRGDGGDRREGVLVEFDEEEWEYERPEEPEVWLVATRPVAAGDSLEVKEDYSNERRLCNYGFVDINRRRERNHFRFEVRTCVFAYERCCWMYVF